MLIIKDRKRQNAKDIFISCDDFINHIKIINDKINFNSNKIIIKVNLIYENMINGDGIIKWVRFNRWIPSQFEFKYSTLMKVAFWIERGWSEEYGKKMISKIVKDGCVNGSKTKLKNKNTIVFDGETEIKIKFKGGEFYSKIHPKCNVCGENLNLYKTNIKNFADQYYYTINGCSNSNCVTHNYRKSEKYKSFLPNEISKLKLHELNNIIKQNNPLCVEYWIRKGCSKEHSINTISEIQRKNSMEVKNRFKPTKENFRKLGYTEEEIKNITLTPTKIQFWINKGHTYEESKKLVSKNQSNATKYVDFKSRILPSNIDYWVKRGFTNEESKVKVKESQTTFSLNKCIQKYGQEEGLKKFTERQNRWLNSLIKNGNLVVGYSKISQDLFNILLENYDVKDRESIFFATHNKEFRIDKINGGVWLYDFTDTINKKIIEFNGDMFHGNPKKYKHNDTPHPFRKNITAQEMWDKDNVKLNRAINEGFEILIIWDSEYRWGNKQKIINKCITFLNKK